MREFKVIRMNFGTGELYEEFLLFESFNKADDWAIEKNEHREGSILDIQEVANHNHNENKYEY